MSKKQIYSSSKTQKGNIARKQRRIKSSTQVVSLAGNCVAYPEISSTQINSLQLFNKFT